MSDDVKHHECPNCGRRVIKEMERDPLERWDEVGLWPVKRRGAGDYERIDTK